MCVRMRWRSALCLLVICLGLVEEIGSERTAAVGGSGRCYSKYQGRFFAAGQRWRELGCTRAECVTDRVTGRATAYVAGCRSVATEAVPPGCRIISLQPDLPWPRCCPQPVCDNRLGTISDPDERTKFSRAGTSNHYTPATSKRSRVGTSDTSLDSFRPDSASVWTVLLQLADSVDDHSCSNSSCARTFSADSVPSESVAFRSRSALISSQNVRAISTADRADHQPRTNSHQLVDSAASASSFDAVRRENAHSSSPLEDSAFTISAGSSFSSSSPSESMRNIDPAIANLLTSASSARRCGRGGQCSDLQDQSVRAHVPCSNSGQNTNHCLAKFLLSLAQTSSDCQQLGNCPSQHRRQEWRQKYTAECEGSECGEKFLQKPCYGESCLGRALVQLNLRHESAGNGIQKLTDTNNQAYQLTPTLSESSTSSTWSPSVSKTNSGTESARSAVLETTRKNFASSKSWSATSESATLPSYSTLSTTEKFFDNFQSATHVPKTTTDTNPPAVSPQVDIRTILGVDDFITPHTPTSSSQYCFTARGPCSHSCVLSSEWQVQCTCPRNLVLSTNGLECIEAPTDTVVTETTKNDRPDRNDNSGSTLTNLQQSSSKHPIPKPAHPLADLPPHRHLDSSVGVQVPWSASLQNRSDPPQLLFSSRDTLYQMRLDGSDLQTVATQLTNAVGLDYDMGRRCIYWSLVQNVSTVNRKCDYRDPEVLYSTPGAPDNLAVDWITGNVYWTDGSGPGRGPETRFSTEHGSLPLLSGSIHVLSYSGRHHRVLVSRGLQKPRGICHLPELGRMYYTDWGDRPFIGTAGMDGSDPRVIVTGDLVWPNALTISRETRQLFWADAKLGRVEVSDLGGRHRRVLLESPDSAAASSTVRQLQHIFSLSVYDRQLFWTSWETNGVVRYNGSHAITLRKTHALPMSLRVLHQSLQKPLRRGNPCSVASCSQLCLLSPDGSGVSAQCACSDDHVTSDNDTKCSRPLSTCKRHEYTCGSLEKCVSLNLLCDGKTDCDDGSDEPTTCPPFHCANGEFQCRTGQCILQSQLCDGVAHCLDGGDEVHCPP